MKNATLYFIIVAIGLWIFACCTWPEAVIIEPIEPPQSEELVIDSCTLTPYNVPNFVCISQRQTSDLPAFAEFRWRGETRSWLFGGFQFASPSFLVLDIVNEVGPSYAQAFVIDNSTTDNGIMNVQYIICFTNPNGLWSEGTLDRIYLDWIGHSQAVTVMNNKAIWLNDIAITPAQVTDLIVALPSFDKFGMRGNNFDSTGRASIHLGLQSPCRTDAIVDSSDMGPIDTMILAQYTYQQMTLQ